MAHKSVFTFIALLLFGIRSSAQFVEDASNSTIINQTAAGATADWGDYDNDGDLDLVISSYDHLTIEIYTNNGGTFTHSSPDVLGTNGGNIQWGDYDGDGDLDLVVTRSRSLSNDFLLKLYNNDEGAFTDVTTDAGLPNILSHYARWGDFNNDGDLDLAVIGMKAGKIRGIIFQNTDGTFADVGAALPEAEEGTVDWADLGDDGDLDLLLTGFDRTQFATRSTIFENNGGTFQDAAAGLTGVMYGAGSWGDYDGDGDLDIVVSGSKRLLANYPPGDPVSIVYRNDNGVFINANAGIANVMYGSAAWGDYDSDGDLDLVVTGLTNYLEGEAVSIVYQYDGGGFTNTGAGLTPAIFGKALWADYDNDTDLDLLLIGQQYIHTTSPAIRKLYTNSLLPITTVSQLSVAENQPEKTVVGTISTLPADTYTYTLPAGVADNDKFTIAGNLLSTAAVFDYEVKSSYPITIESSVGGEIKHSQTFNVSVADVNEAPTLITLSNQSVNRSAGAPAPVGTLSATDQDAENSFTFTLVNGEGDGFNAQFEIADNTLFVKHPAALSAGTYSIRVKVADQDEAAFEQVFLIEVVDDVPLTFVRNDAASDVIDDVIFSASDWADYDGDGDRDLLMIGFDNQSTFISRIYSNNDGDFTNVGANLPAIEAGSARWGVSAEGAFAEVLLTGAIDGVPHTGVYQFEGDSWTLKTGDFAPVGELGSSFASWADYDQDGDLDIALVGITPDDTKLSKIYRNDGGTYVDIEAPLEAVSTGHAEWADFDNDGDLDLALGGDGWFEYVTKIYRNDNGQFVDLEAGLTPSSATSMRWGDYDNDGDSDLLVNGIDIFLITHTFIYNNDGGVFTELEIDLGFENSCADWGDFDHDGDFDIIVTGTVVATQTIGTRVFENKNGEFADTMMDLPGAIFGEVQWVNIDADNDLDFYITGFDGQQMISDIYVNQLLSNRAPEALLLDNAHLSQSAGAQALVGTFSSTDPDDGDIHSYLLTAGAGGVHNGLFNLNDGKLYVLKPSEMPAGQYSIRVAVSDQKGGKLEKTFSITVEDDVAPIAVVKDTTLVLDEHGVATLSAAQADAGSYDPAGGAVTMTLSKESFTCENLGPNEISFATTDGAGNSSSVTFTVTIQDKTSPVLKVRGASIYLDKDGAAALTVGAIDDGSSDNCGINLSLSKTVFTCQDLGTNEITLTGTDPSGNSSTASALVQVLDTIAPAVAGQHITVHLGENGIVPVASINVDFGSSDNCGLESLYLNWPSDLITCADIGNHEVDIIGIDKSGNRGSASVSISVVDNIPPQVFARPITVTLNEQGEADILPEDLDDDSFDNCGIEVFSLSQSHFTCDDLGDLAIELSAVDFSGNTSTIIVTVTVDGNCGEALGLSPASADVLMTYPNPAHSFVTVALRSGHVLSGEAAIYDLSGRVVHQSAMPADSQTLELPTAGLSPGLYYLVLAGKAGTWRTSFVKK